LDGDLPRAFDEASLTHVTPERTRSSQVPQLAHAGFDAREVIQDV
jgi:hypothetical protein